MSVCCCILLLRGRVDQERPAKEVTEARSKVGDSQKGVHLKREAEEGNRKDNTQEKICSENQVKNVF